MGNKVDHWFELYGKAVLDNTLQDRIEFHKMQQLEKEQQQQQYWNKSEGNQQQEIRRQDFRIPSNYEMLNKGHTNYQQSSQNPKQSYGYHSQSNNDEMPTSNHEDEVDKPQSSGVRQLWIKSSHDGTKKFSYVHQLLMEEEQEKLKLKNEQQNLQESN